METDYETLHKRLADARCPYKLYPARLRALEIVTGERLLPEVEETITMRVALAAGDRGWKLQFKRDFETYGLLEAILYFHSYPSLPGDFVEAACGLYERLATLYIEHHQEIVTSDDPRVCVQLELLRRFGDSSLHSLPQHRRQRRSAPNGIAIGEPPHPVPGYRRTLPVHPDLSTIGMADVVYCLPDELVELLAAGFMFDGFPGLQGAFFDAADTLEEHGIDVFGSDGQFVIGKLVDYVNEEMFGDFERWVPCIECGEEFMVTVSVESVNDSLLDGGWTCDDCKAGAAEQR